MLYVIFFYLCYFFTYFCVGYLNIYLSCILIQILQFLCEHTTVKFIEPIQVKLFDMIKQNCSNHLIFLDCLNILITTKHGSLVKDSAMFADFLKSCTPTDKQPSANLFKCYSSLLLEDVDKSSDVYDKCIGLVTKSKFEVNIFYKIVLSLDI